MATKPKANKNNTDTPWPLGRDPEPGEAGSIEQQLDMLEEGNLKGDLVLGHRDDLPENSDDAIEDVDEMMNNYRIDMAETSREGDEESGDEHSSGLQGGEPDIENQEHIETGMPGDMTNKEDFWTKKRSIA